MLQRNHRSLNAANALSVENISVTPDAKEDDTELLSPPEVDEPHVTTEPSIFQCSKC